MSTSTYSYPYAATPWTGAAEALPQPTGPLRDYIRAIAWITWSFLLVLPFWYLRDWRDIYDVRGSGFDRTLQYIGYGVPMTASLVLGLGTLADLSIGVFRTVKGRMLGSFCFLMFLLSPISILPLRSAGYALSLLGALLLARWMWYMDYDRFRRMMGGLGIVLLAFLLVLAIHHGQSNTSVGGIGRNKYGQAALTGVIALFFTRSRWKWAGFLAGVGMALIVNSRGTLLALAILLIVYTTLKMGMGRGILLALCGLVAGIGLLAVPRIGDRLKTGVAEDVMKVNDRNRGLGSGFTGRWESWMHGLESFSLSPAVGHGFRTRNTSTDPRAIGGHSGYINLLGDTGLVGAILLLGTFLYDFFKRLRLIAELKRQFRPAEAPTYITDTLELNYLVCAFLLAEGVLWLFEPLYMNLGATISVMFLLILMAPMVLMPGTRHLYAVKYRGGAIVGA